MFGKKQFILALVPFFALMLLAPFAQAEETKIAYVDFQSALRETIEGKRVLAELEKFMEDNQKKLDEKQNAVVKMMEDFEKQQAMMSNEQQKLEKRTQLQKEYQATQQLYMELQQKLERKKAEKLEPIQQKMQAIIRKIAEKKGFSYVFDKNLSGIIHAPKKYDLTSDLIREYDKQYK